jgi:hypothetical protein
MKKKRPTKVLISLIISGILNLFLGDILMITSIGKKKNEYTQMPYFPMEYMYRECPPKMPMSYEPYFACSPYSS